MVVRPSDVCEDLRAEDQLIVELIKAVNPLSRSGFDRLVLRLRRALTRASSPSEKRAASRALRLLDRDWAALSPLARRNAIRAAQGAIESLPAAVVTATKPVFSRWASLVVVQTREFVRRTLRLDVPRKLRDIDERVVRFVRESPTNFVTNQYRQRVAALGPRVRGLVATGLERGLARDEINQMLLEDMTFHLAGRSKSYWDVTSHVFVNRGRTLSQLSIYEENEIRQFEFRAVLDYRTSDICRLMHGRVWSVGAELDRFKETQQLREPEAIRDAAPFVRRGKDAEGRPGLFVEREGRRQQLARIEESAVGQEGRRGRFSGIVSDATLQRWGVVVPPLHGRCRSTIVPLV